MRLAYVLYLDVEKYDGVASKVVSQVEAWQAMGHQVKLYCLVPRIPVANNPLTRIAASTTYFVEEKVLGASAGLLVGWLLSDRVQKELLNTLQGFNPDVVYYRNTAYSSTIYKLNKLFVTVCEINTLELSEYKLQKFDNVKYFLRFLHYFILHRFALKNVNGIVGVTYEIVKQILNTGFTASTAVIPNSINVAKHIQKHSPENMSAGVPRLVFIGTPGMSWHGVDRIMEIAKRTQQNLEYHIIGYGAGDFVDAPDNVVFYGVLPSTETKEVISKCHIGIGTMALFRKGMEEACPLKVRECLAYGLPMVLGYEDTAFIDDSRGDGVAQYPDFILCLPNSINDIEGDVKKILDFANRNSGRLLTYEDVAPYIDVHLLEKKRIAFLQKVYETA